MYSSFFCIELYFETLYCNNKLIVFLSTLIIIQYMNFYKGKYYIYIMRLTKKM